MSTQMETRAQTRIDRRDVVHGKAESLLAERGDGELSDTDKKQLEMYREEIANLDEEIAQLANDIEANNRAVEQSKALRRAMLGAVDGVDEDGDGVVYRSFATYARDVILTRDMKTSQSIAQRLPGDEVEAARARLQLLKRTPANTLSSNVAGLIPDQHIAQIFQVIDSSRPLVASATRANLERGQLTFPKITTRPVVAVQTSEKTEAGNTGMVVGMETATASTYLGGGDLSWQAINWSTPDALDLWFRLAAADYALKTEQDAGEVLQTNGFLNIIGTPLDGTDTYDDWVQAIMDGAAEVYANSGRMADTLYLAPDQFYAFAALIPATAPAAFVGGGVNVGGQGGSFAGMRLVVSRGLDAGVALVGDAQALIVAETAGAPVELRVVEPAIGGVEVGIIGAFEAVAVEDEAFALITTAS